MATTTQVATATPVGSRMAADATEQRQVYDSRVPTWLPRVASLIIGFLWFTRLQWKLPWNSFGSLGPQPVPAGGDLAAPGGTGAAYLGLIYRHARESV